MRIAPSLALLLLLIATPGHNLRAESPRNIARFQAVQELAVEHGLVERVLSHAELVQAFQADNRRRREMKAAGEVFYGPVQFREELWFEVWFDQLSRGLQRKTGEPMDEQIEARIRAILAQNFQSSTP